MIKRSIHNVQIHWIHIVLLLIFAILVGSVGVGYYVQKNPLIGRIDVVLFEYSRLLHSTFLDLVFYPFNFNFLPFGGSGPVYLYFMSVALLVYVRICKRSLFKSTIFSLIVSYALGYVITYVDWKFVFRIRPFLVIPSDVGFFARDAWSQVSSFPSGHARDSAIFTTLVANYVPRLSVPAALFAILIATSRVYLGAHYPSDVISGLIIGYLAAKVTLFIARELKLILHR